MGVDKVALRAVFLDRDGVINQNVVNPSTGKYESPLRAEDVVLHDGVIEALHLLAEKFQLILVSNQPNYAKGKASLETLEKIHNRIFRDIQAAGISFTAVHYCLHHPEGVVEGYSGGCNCRKPSPFFLLQDAARYNISLAESWMVGDRAADIQCGQAAGVKTIRIKEDHPVISEWTQPKADYVANNLFEAARIILG